MKKMILAEKVAMLRKQKGWSQEKLAELLDISRQSVSKWESGVSIPDIDKIIRMSNLFGVSTDYLLKDELEDVEQETVVGVEDTQEEEDFVRSVSLEEATVFMELSEKLSRKIALGVAMLVLSPVCLIFLGGMAEYRSGWITESMAGGIGVAVLLVIIALAVVMLILSGMRMDRYEYLEKERFLLQYGVQGIVERKREEFGETYRKCVAVGTGLCILGVVPLMLAYGLEAGEIVYVWCIDVLLILIACGVYLFVWSGMIHSSYEKLLQQGEYTCEEKELNKKTAPFSGIYWCLATALYLGISLTRNNWDRSWVVWPVAGVLFAALYGGVKVIAKRHK